LTHTGFVVAESVCNFGMLPMQFDHTSDLCNFVVSAMQFDHTDSFGRLSDSYGRVKKISCQVKLFYESLQNCHTGERIKNESGKRNESGTNHEIRTNHELWYFCHTPLQWKLRVPPTVEIKSDPLQWKLGFDIGCESVHTYSGNKEKIKWKW
jgi:hypothetical protein